MGRPRALNQAATLGLLGALALGACGRDSPVGGPGKGGEAGFAIPDARLRAAIAGALGKSGETPITVDEMASLTRLDAPNSGIRDLTGLEFATSLTRLHLGTDKVDGEYVNSNDISDLTPLAGLTNLTHLTLTRTGVSDLAPLAGLTNLTRLFLGDNSIVDLTPLAGLTNLTDLWLWRNDLSDLRPLAGLTNLTRLELSSADVSDLPPLAGLTNLTELRLGDNALTDLTPLAGLTSLTWLFLSDNRVSDLAPLTGLTSLTSLSLGQNSIADLTPLAGLTGLTWLSLDENSIADITPLSGLPSLTWLHLDANSIADLTPLAGLPDLTGLFVDENSVVDLTPLAGMTHLRSLFLRDNSVSDLTPLAGLTDLTTLELSDNSIADLVPLADLTTLTELRLENNSISDLTPLAGLINLVTLWLGDNAITDVTPLAGLTNLIELRLENNHISDLAPLVENTGLGFANWIDVRGNPLSDESIDTHIPALQARGVISDGHGGETPLAIPDARLHAAIANELGKAGNDPITAREMTALTHLFALESDIVELTGLEYAINLTSLQLYGNRVSDLTPLAGLTNLTRLHLRRNSITDLRPLAGLINLTTLYLSYNQASDLTPLAGLTSLTDLDLYGNGIMDLTPLAGLTNLTTLELGANSISRLPVGLFADLADLETLHLGRNPGAPFALTLELERTDTDNRLAPSPAGVAVRLAEGAPFEMTVPLSVFNGSVSVASLTIGAGDTTSAPAQVTAPAGSSTATHVVLDHAPLVPSGFTGIEIGTGGPLELFAESDGHFPVAEEIPPHVLQVGGPQAVLDVAEFFSDADGDELVYSVTSNDGGLVGTRVNAGVMTLSPRAEGHGSVVVAATDPGGLGASQELSVTVLPAPNPHSFDIDLVFVGAAAEEARSAALQMAERWTEVITGDLRDVPVPDNTVHCLGEHRFFGTVDDLVVFVAVESLPHASGVADLCRTRDRYTPLQTRRYHGSSLPCMGYVVLDRDLVAQGKEAWGREYLATVILHEMGHALGVGPLWHDSGFLQDWGGADPHFNGPLAIEAFDAAGGTNYTGAKVPVTARGAHWRFGGELMSAGAGSALSAVTVQSLADLGYVVDVSRADPFRLSGSAKAVAGPGLDLHDDILQGPIEVVDEDGHVVRVIHP